jgi:hypothetical protein
MTRADPGNRPGGLIIDQHRRPVRSQMVVDEVCVRLRQAAPLDAEVAHSFRHQDVLQLIKYVVQHDIAITIEQRRGYE